MAPPGEGRAKAGGVSSTGQLSHCPAPLEWTLPVLLCNREQIKEKGSGAGVALPETTTLPPAQPSLREGLPVTCSSWLWDPGHR